MVAELSAADGGEDEGGFTIDAVVVVGVPAITVGVDFSARVLASKLKTKGIQSIKTHY